MIFGIFVGELIGSVCIFIMGNRILKSADIEPEAAVLNMKIGWMIRLFFILGCLIAVIQISVALFWAVVTGFFLSEFIMLANKVLNRRKSRAGKSLEHHLAAIFDGNKIRYTPQAVTEGNKRPDFIFPSEADYHDVSFSIEKICSLAAKTTCKDRWRQILNEGDRFKGRYKYLCTMQQGISSAQMDEMQAEKVILVVPKTYISTYPKDRQERIWTIGKFVDFVKEMEGLNG